MMKPDDFSGILTRGGTILGTSRQPFKLMRVIDENSVDKVAEMKKNYKKLELDCLVVLGGNGTQKTANLLREEGLMLFLCQKQLTMTFGVQIKHLVFRAPLTLQQMLSTVFTPPQPHTEEFSLLRLWVTRLAG